MDIENINQPSVPIEGSSQNQSSSPEDQHRQPKRFIIILGIIAALFTFGLGGYFLGTNKNQTTPQLQQVTVSPTPSQQSSTSMPATKNNIQEYIAYQYNVFHIGTPVFQVQIPKDWSAYTEYSQSGKAQVVHFGESQYEIKPGIVSNVPSTVEIRLIKDASLSKQNPENWSSNQRVDIIGGSGQFNWTDTTVGSLPAKVGSFGGVSCNERFVLLTQNNLIFSFHVPVCEDEKTDPLLPVFNHILSTFKILNPDPVGL